MFLPLKVTTDYTMLESMITIPKLLLFLKKYQITMCGICDKNLFGVLEFYNTLKENNIKPLIGLEIKLDNIPLYLYAKDYHGYLSLLKINTLVEKEELTIEQLEKYEDNLNVVLPYLYIEKYKEWQEKFKNFYIGYTSDYEKNNALILTDNLIFCPDLKAFTKKDSNYLNLLTSIDTGNPVNLIENKNYEKNSFEYYFKETIDLSKTLEFANSCNVEIPKGYYIPKFKKDIDSFSYLQALTKKGLTKRLAGKVTEKYVDRLKYELNVIERMGFSDYFLIVYDYVRFAKQNGILVGAGRGSAVGSLVSYSLGITDVDPLEYNLLFERFLNPDRVTMPDIDIDFEDKRRDEVISYVKQKYGFDCVANILAFGTLKSKLVLRSVGKALEINQNVVDSFVMKIDAKISLEENLKNKDVLYYVKNNNEIKKMFTSSLKIEGLKKHITTHAAGVVISSVPLDTVIPIHYSGDSLLTGTTMNYLENLGLLKMDFLSISNLTVIKNILELIEKNTKEILDINKINLNDKNVLNLFTNALTNGIFQFESEGMKSFLRKLKPTKFLDLVSAIALYRPGPMENIDSFIRRKEGKEKIDYLHNDLKNILEETYGIIVYQEQIMQILVIIGGFSFSEADTIRRAMSKKKKEIIDSSKDHFIKGAIKNGYEKSLAENIFELILKFANYGFNKSHSVSYALIGYQMAYLKTYYNVYFIANLLNMTENSVTKTQEYIALAKKSGIKILPPSINESDLSYKIKENTLRIPLTVIKNVGEESAKLIIKEREQKKYTDFFDFVSRTYGKSVTKKTIESLIAGGALDEFKNNHNTLRANLDNALKYAELVSGLEENTLMKPAIIEEKEESEIDRREEEYLSFGFYISNHPASSYIDKTIMKLKNIKECYNKHIKCVVLVEKIKEIMTKNNEKMAFLTASDETDVGNFVVFRSTMKDLENIKTGELVLIEGRVARRMLEYQINVNKIEKINKGE